MAEEKVVGANTATKDQKAILEQLGLVGELTDFIEDISEVIGGVSGS